MRYRTKNKNVGRAAVESFALAAESMGITPEERHETGPEPRHPWAAAEVPSKPDQTAETASEPGQSEFERALDQAESEFDPAFNQPPSGLDPALNRANPT